MKHTCGQPRLKFAGGGRGLGLVFVGSLLYGPGDRVRDLRLLEEPS